MTFHMWLIALQSNSFKIPYLFSSFFFLFFKNNFIQFLIYIEIFQCCLCLLLDYWGTFCAGVPFFRCSDSNPDNANNAFNDVGHPDPHCPLNIDFIPSPIPKFTMTPLLNTITSQIWGLSGGGGGHSASNNII